MDPRHGLMKSTLTEQVGSPAVQSFEVPAVNLQHLIYVTRSQSHAKWIGTSLGGPHLVARHIYFTRGRHGTINSSGGSRSSGGGAAFQSTQNITTILNGTMLSRDSSYLLFLFRRLLAHPSSHKKER